MPVSDGMPGLDAQIDPPHVAVLPPMLQHRTAARVVVVSAHCVPVSELHWSDVIANGCSGEAGGGGGGAAGGGGQSTAPCAGVRIQG